MKSKVPWLRVFVEGVVIVVSILLAFGLDAWWDQQQERERRAELMLDLREEIESNRSHLTDIIARMESRNARMDQLVRALDGEAGDISSDSLRALRDSVRLNPTFDPAFGVLNLLLQSGELALLEDSELRVRLAGLDGLMTDLLSNAEGLVALNNSPEVAFETGSFVFPSGTRDSPDGTAAERLRAQQFLRLGTMGTDLMISQGQALHAELGEILSLIDAADFNES